MSYVRLATPSTCIVVVGTLSPQSHEPDVEQPPCTLHWHPQVTGVGRAVSTISQAGGPSPLPVCAQRPGCSGHSCRPVPSLMLPPRLSPHVDCSAALHPPSHCGCSCHVIGVLRARSPRVAYSHVNAAFPWLIVTLDY